MTAFKAGPFKAALIQTNVSNEMAENVAFVRAQAKAARGVEQEAAVGEPLGLDADRHRADQQEDTELLGERREIRQSRMLILGERFGQRQLSVGLDDAGILGRRDELGTLRRRIADQRRGGVEIGADLGAGRHLHAGEFDRGVAHANSPSLLVALLRGRLRQHGGETPRPVKRV